MANHSAPPCELHSRWALVGVVVGLALLVHTPGYVHQLFDPDEAAIASQAISMREGGTLYVDAIDRKPPLPPLLYEASFRLTGSNDLRPLHLLSALGLAGAALVVGSDVRRRHGPTAGWWAALLTVGGAVAFFPVDAQAANYAHLALFPGAVAVVMARRGTIATAGLAGVALAVAILCRQSWSAGIIPALAAAWLGVGGVARPVAARVVQGLGRVVALVAGTVCGVVAVGVKVPLSKFWEWTFTGTSDYVLSEVSPGATAGRFVATVAIFAALHLSLFVAVLVAMRDRGRNLSDWRHDLDLWLWLGAGCVSVLAGFRFFGHYWIQTLPPAAMLAAPVLARVGHRVRPWAMAGLAVPTVAAVAFAFMPSTFRELPDPTALADYVEANSAPGEAVMVWGNFPELHWTADRPPGGGLVHSDFITGRSGGREAGPQTIGSASPGAVEALLEAVRRNPPVLVVDTSTAGLRDYDAYPLALFPEVERFVVDNYEKVATVDGAVIWERR